MNKISQQLFKTVLEELDRNTKIPKRGMDGRHWKILTLKNAGPTFFKFISIFMKVSIIILGNHRDGDCDTACVTANLEVLYVILFS